MVGLFFLVSQMTNEGLYMQPGCVIFVVPLHSD